MQRIGTYTRNSGPRSDDLAPALKGHSAILPEFPPFASAPKSCMGSCGFQGSHASKVTPQTCCQPFKCGVAGKKYYWGKRGGLIASSAGIFSDLPLAMEPFGTSSHQ